MFNFTLKPYPKSCSLLIDKESRFWSTKQDPEGRRRQNKTKSLRNLPTPTGQITEVDSKVTDRTVIRSLDRSDFIYYYFSQKAVKSLEEFS